jgi:hypothetical protein
VATAIVTARHTEHLPKVDFLRAASRTPDPRMQIVPDNALVAA